MISEKVKNSLQNFYNSLGERAKPLIIKNTIVKALFDRYGIEYESKEV